MNSLDILWTAQTHNSKTGNIPTGWIGKTKEETAQSCQGCALYKQPGGKFRCYAWAGMINVGLGNVQKKAAEYPENYKLRYALANRSKKAKAVRIGAIGDPGALPVNKLKRYWKSIKANGLSVLCYTHKWRELKEPDWKQMTMASCDNLEQADEAFDLGWKPSVVLSPESIKEKRVTTPKGRTVIICPAMKLKEMNKDYTCNDCRLCDASELKSGIGIGFPDHGPSARGKGKKLTTV